MNFHQTRVSVETVLPIYSTLQFEYPVKVCAFLRNRPSRLARKREIASDIIHQERISRIIPYIPTLLCVRYSRAPPSEHIFLDLKPSVTLGERIVPYYSNILTTKIRTYQDAQWSLILTNYGTF
jgi:hypothetical protein